MIIQILISGEPGNVSAFHTKMSFVMNRLKQESNQTIYSCLQDQYNDIEREAMKYGLSIHKWDPSKKEWIESLKRTVTQKTKLR